MLHDVTRFVEWDSENPWEFDVPIQKIPFEEDLKNHPVADGHLVEAHLVMVSYMYM